MNSNLKHELEPTYPTSLSENSIMKLPRNRQHTRAECHPNGLPVRHFIKCVPCCILCLLPQGIGTGQRPECLQVSSCSSNSNPARVAVNTSLYPLLSGCEYLQQPLLPEFSWMTTSGQLRQTEAFLTTARCLQTHPASSRTLLLKKYMVRNLPCKLAFFSLV